MNFKLKYSFILILYLSVQSAFAQAAQSEKYCRTYFVQNDVLNKFSLYEKPALETAARSLADLIGSSKSDQLQTKEDLDTSMRKLLSQKKFSIEESSVFMNWFKERIQFYIELKTEPQRAAALHAQIRKNQLEKEKRLVDRKIKNINRILKIYKAHNLSDALIAAQQKKIGLKKWNIDTRDITEHILFILSYFKSLDLTDEIFQIMVQYDYLPAVEYFIHKKINLNSVDTKHSDYTPLHFALEYNSNPKIIQILVQSNDVTGIQAKDRQGKTALHHAASTPHVKFVKILIEAGADPTSVDHANYIPLHYAASNRQIGAAAVEALLKVKSDEQIHFRTEKDRQTPLQLAVDAKNLDAVKMLLEVGVDPSTQSKLGYTALHFAAGSDSVEILKLLIQADQGAQLHAKDDEGRTPLHLAAQKNPNLEIVEALLHADNGAQLNAKDIADRTPINLAAHSNKNPKIIKLLLEFNFNAQLNIQLNVRNKRGQTLLHHSISNPNPEVLKIILDAGADPTLKDNENKTALACLNTTDNQMAAELSNSKMARFQYKRELLRQAMQEWEIKILHQAIQEWEKTQQ